jgi:hypothetical protein
MQIPSDMTFWERDIGRGGLWRYHLSTISAPMVQVSNFKNCSLFYISSVAVANQQLKNRLQITEIV